MFKRIRDKFKIKLGGIRYKNYRVLLDSEYQNLKRSDEVYTKSSNQKNQYIEKLENEIRILKQLLDLAKHQ